MHIIQYLLHPTWKKGKCFRNYIFIFHIHHKVVSCSHHPPPSTIIFDVLLFINKNCKVAEMQHKSHKDYASLMPPQSLFSPNHYKQLKHHQSKEQ